MTIRAFSYGGGVQSTAALVLAAQGKIDFRLFLFSNVGDDSERADTLTYVHDVAMPFAEEHEIELRELRHMRRDGTEETLYRKLTRPGSRSTGIPIFLEGSGAPGRRSCTADFKIRRIRKELRRRGASADEPAIVGLGISLDEFQRMRSESGFPDQRLEYPLITLRLTRQDCINIIARAGLPVPPKSSCWFCPFHRIPVWQEMLRNEPKLFDRAVALEVTLSDRSESLGRGKVFLSRKMRPLDQVVGEQADMFESDDACESGFCMT
jgi:hypothetical protein